LNLTQNRKHIGKPAASANFVELQIKTGRFMFFIVRLTDNTNLAATIPPFEHVFNTAIINIGTIRKHFEALDVATKKRKPEAPPSRENRGDNDF
jgi:Ras-related GTP-binding protein A/B